MANLGSSIHGLGEKFGMYVTPGVPKAAYDQNTPIQGTSFHARDIVSDTTDYETNYGGWGNVMYYIDYAKNPSAAQAFLNSWANLLASFSRSLPAHGSALLKVTPAAGSTAVGGLLVSALSGRCADDPAGTTTNATQLTVFDCNNGTNQKVLYNASSKTLKVLGKCFDAHGAATTAGTHVEIYDCNGGANQQWNVNSNGTITGVQSGICLDVTGSTNPNGAGLELWPCNNGANQLWMLGSGVRS